MTDSLSPAGSSTYSSNSMFVGDGTWDSTRNTFLLPNLQGLNFATMQYNGMGNRFRELPQYRSLIRGHGVLAAITFLGIVPAAILIARFYHRNPRLALRLHIWLQILTVGLVTVVFTIGWFAVGPERSLTNPHHGIGLAIYVLVLVQAIGGGLIHHIEKKKLRYKIPLKLMLHQWFGRAIALLGIVQIPLGLTLYGSPKVLFILYTLAVFALLLLYFVLTYRYQPVVNYDDDDDGSYTSASRTDMTGDRRSRRGGGHALRNLAAGAAGLAGLAALRNRSQSRTRQRRGTEGQSEVISSQHGSRPPSRPPSGSFIEEEKRMGHSYGRDRRGRTDHTWRDRILGAGAGVAGIAALRSYFNRDKGKRRDSRDSDVGSYSAPMDGAQTVSRTDLSRLEEGNSPMSPGDQRWHRTERIEAAQMASPTRPNLRTRRSGDSISSYDSRTSLGGTQQRQHGGRLGIKDGIVTLGLFGYLKEKQRERREGKEERRLEEIRRNQINNAERAKHDNRRRQREEQRHGGSGGRLGSHTEMTAMGFNGGVLGAGGDPGLMGSNPELSRSRLNANPTYGPPPPISAPGPPMAGPSNVVDLGYDPRGGVPPPANTVALPPPNIGYTAMPTGPVEPDPQHLLQHANEHASHDAAAAAAGAAGGASAATRYRARSSSRQGRNSSSGQSGSVTSPPVSVKVKMHNDGRHVTLRRLNEEEAAAEREARRRERSARRERKDSLSSTGTSDERWRRAERMEAAQAAGMSKPQQPPTQAQARLPPFAPQQQLQQASVYPPPPPIPSHGAPSGIQHRPSPSNAPAPSGLTSGVGSSPGAGGRPAGSGSMAYGTETDVSNFEDNRKRRRAERAAAKARALEGGGGRAGQRVEFT
ncbi:hypothetical protein B0A49_07006 [Cryomyces minteri]|uniref:Cytochrome b561 domain-containing protein n=1 Tax=Cryomyces minteri TaxID=331657 RepID=A0A4U0X401_9PEZI|nr:hypothetical protein B0A49_07006 [Cryomyces minteri]